MGTGDRDPVGRPCPHRVCRQAGQGHCEYTRYRGPSWSLMGRSRCFSSLTVSHTDSDTQQHPPTRFRRHSQCQCRGSLASVVGVSPQLWMENPDLLEATGQVLGPAQASSHLGPSQCSPWL